MMENSQVHNSRTLLGLYAAFLIGVLVSAFADAWPFWVGVPIGVGVAGVLLLLVGFVNEGLP